jgi:hypothetical protein
LAWLAYFGFPNEWGDVVFFKQPAYMALHTGRFTLPTAIGFLPFADITYAAYPPLYTYANLIIFKVFGFGVQASLAFDLIVHWILAAVVGWILWRKTRSQFIAALFVLLSTGFLLPEGRPDELAALLAILAIMATARRRHLLAASLLGLSMATQLTQGLAGLIICVCIDLVASRLTPRFVARSAVVGASALVVCLLVWLPAVLPHLPEAIAQFRAHNADRWAPDFAELVTREPIRTVLWLAIVAFVAGRGIFLVLRPPDSVHQDAGDRILLQGVLLAMPLCIGFLLIVRSPSYGYRLLDMVYFALTLYLAHDLISATKTVGRIPSSTESLPMPDAPPAPVPTELSLLAPGTSTAYQAPKIRPGWRARQAAATAVLAAILSLGAVMNYNIVRFALAPLTWDDQTMTYKQAVATVQAIVPPDATVGGDSLSWWTITDGRPFLFLNWYKAEPWPEYIVSTTLWGRGGKPNVLQRSEWADRIEAEYVEVTPAGAPAESCQLRIFDRSVPLSRSGGGCDWRVRIWKRM